MSLVKRLILPNPQAYDRQNVLVGGDFEVSSTVPEAIMTA
jgi:hypothetical protein